MLIKEHKHIEFFSNAFDEDRELRDGIKVFNVYARALDHITLEWHVWLHKDQSVIKTFDPNYYYEPDPDWIELPDHTMRRVTIPHQT